MAEIYVPLTNVLLYRLMWARLYNWLRRKPIDETYIECVVGSPQRCYLGTCLHSFAFSGTEC